MLKEWTIPFFRNRNIDCCNSRDEWIVPPSVSLSTTGFIVFNCQCPLFTLCTFHLHWALYLGVLTFGYTLLLPYLEDIFGSTLVKGHVCIMSSGRNVILTVYGGRCIQHLTRHFILFYMQAEFDVAGNQAHHTGTLGGNGPWCVHDLWRVSTDVNQ